jgi:hypothetical protein
MAVLSLLMASIMFIYVTGAGAWAKGDAQAELLNVLQTASLKLANEIQRSCYDSVTVDANSLSCLSAEDLAKARLTVDATSGELVWQRYLVFYRDAGRNALVCRAVPLPAGASQRETPGLLVSFNPAATTNAPYCAGGEVLARRVADVRFRQDGQLVEFTLTAEMKRPRREDPERIEQRVLVKVRN